MLEDEEKNTTNFYCVMLFGSLSLTRANVLEASALK